MDNLTQGTKITYVNKSANKNLPQVFVFAQNETPNFNSLKEGVAWEVIKDIGRGSRSNFYYSNDEHYVQATWDDNENSTAQIIAQVGSKYHIVRDTTGIVLKSNGEASDTDSIEIVNDIEVVNGVTAQYCKNGLVMLEKNQVGYHQSAIFIPSNKIFFGLASEISEGDSLQSAILNTENFFELDLNGLSNVTISLNGNAQIGYQFQIEEGN
ncbi:hypothetical protein PG911_05530 [Tenacibaculum ovolyticum]|uniref:hypothetical protein n=1 Tax=Tenacibaculum ovolyticum TaxID=104270 RepID=UPI0022F39647|nr:hypothetical protein [Tenacibaculum ovolyticum]WBX77721.1 hypothetical protein PG911_05530 [Tenacibaculum ovolyticum]